MSDAGEKRAEAQVLADHLRELLFDFTMPSGHALRENTIASEHGVSRATARETIRVLVEEGLARHERFVGARVRTFTRDDVADLYRVRRVLEVQGAAACVTASDDLLDGVEQAARALERVTGAEQDTKTHARADLGFHASVILLIGSERITRFFASIEVEMAYAIRLLHREEVERQHSIEQVVAEHRYIADLLLARDALGATNAVREHLRVNEALLLRLIGDGENPPQGRK